MIRYTINPYGHFVISNCVYRAALVGPSILTGELSYPQPVDRLVAQLLLLHDDPPVVGGLDDEGRILSNPLPVGDGLRRGLYEALNLHIVTKRSTNYLIVHPDLGTDYNTQSLSSRYKERLGGKY